MSRRRVASLRVIAAMLAAFLLPAAHGVSAQDEGGMDDFDVRSFTCPLDGHAFRQDVGYPSLVLVQFPDGSWLGDQLIDTQIPECPGNGLVLIPDFDAQGTSSTLSYRTYTPAEAARLPALVADPAYRSLKGRYERAVWLARQLGLSPRTRLELLMRTTWATADAAERKRRVARLVEQGPALIDAMQAKPVETLVLRLRIVNALRELGRFDEAKAQLDALRTTAPDDLPEGDPDSIVDARDRLARMAETIAARDDDRFPVDLGFDRWVRAVCGGSAMPPPYGPITQNAKAACARRERAEREAAEAEREAERLGADAAALARRCEATPDAARAPGLQLACRGMAWQRDRDAGEARARAQPQQVAADCEATPPAARRDATAAACTLYEQRVVSALSILLLQDAGGFTIVCGDDDRRPTAHAAVFREACESAATWRDAPDGLASKQALDAPDEADRALAAVAADTARRFLDQAKAELAPAARASGDAH